MNKYEQCRSYSDACRVMASKAGTAQEKALLSQMAETWAALAEEYRRSMAFDTTAP